MTDKYAVVWDNFSNQAFAADVTRKSFQENFEPDHQFILPSRYSSRARADACALALMGMEFDEHLIASEIWFDNSDWEGVRIESQIARDFHRARAMSGDKDFRDRCFRVLTYQAESRHLDDIADYPEADW